MFLCFIFECQFFSQTLEDIFICSYLRFCTSYCLFSFSDKLSFHNWIVLRGETSPFSGKIFNDFKLLKKNHVHLSYFNFKWSISLHFLNINISFHNLKVSHKLMGKKSSNLKKACRRISNMFSNCLVLFLPTFMTLVVWSHFMVWKFKDLWTRSNQG